MPVYKCQKCSKQFSQKCHYDYHAYKRKRPCVTPSIEPNHKTNPKPNPKSNPKYKCSECDIPFATKSNLNRHNKRFHAPKNDPPQISIKHLLLIKDSETESLADLEQSTQNDVEISTDETPNQNNKIIICNFCQSTFATKSSLNRHTSKYCKTKQNIEDERNQMLEKIEKLSDQVEELKEFKEQILKQQKETKKMMKQFMSTISNQQQDIKMLKKEKVSNKNDKFNYEMLKPYSIQPKYEHTSFYDDNMISTYDKKKVVYIGYIGIYNNEHVFKFGKTLDIFSRDIKKHRKNYGLFDVIYIKECFNYEVVETQFKKELIAKNLIRKIEINGKNRAELFTITSKKSIDSIKNVMDNLVETFTIY